MPFGLKGSFCEGTSSSRHAAQFQCSLWVDAHARRPYQETAWQAHAQRRHSLHDEPAEELCSTSLCVRLIGMLVESPCPWADSLNTPMTTSKVNSDKVAPYFWKD